jgi:hypothetical protein
VADRTVVLELAGTQHARDLQAGGVFVPGHDLPLNEECDLVLRAGDRELRVAARVVWSQNGGIGLQLHDFDAELKAKIAELTSTGATEPTEPTDDAPGDEAPEETKTSSSLHERLRGLTLVQQQKIAAHGEHAERVMLERIYGKSVWDALLRNPRLTGPEVARIARMGALPRPQLEVILNNGAWLQIPEVRRALLSNPRLGTDQVMRILRMLPKHEMKLAAQQTAYPLAVRTAAKTILKESGGG